MELLPRVKAGAAPLRAGQVSRTMLVLLEGLGVFAICAALFAFVQFGTPGLADNDGYYHMRMGVLVREQGLRPAFPWLPLTILRPEQFYDHHLLYHVYLALFTGDGQDATLIMGAKVASVVMPSLAFVAIWWLLRGQEVRWAWLWTLGLFAVSDAFLYRMSTPRTQAASLLVLALGLHWLLTRRYALLLPLGAFYVWLYNAFPLLPVVAGIYLCAALLAERRLEWKALAYPTAGVALGLVVNPYFPQNIDFIVHHLAPKIGSPETSVGVEWYPYDTWVLVQNSGFALAAWVLGAFAIGWRDRRMGVAALAAFALSVAFGFLLFKSRRFVEYFPPFALIFVAMSAAPLVEGMLRAVRRMGSDGRVSSAARLRLPSPIREGLVPLGLALAIALPAAVVLPRARAALAGSAPSETYAAASYWLRQHTPPGSMVFQTDWDDFPRLFFYNTSNVYTVGLDPTYMERYDPELYDEWVRITRGQVERPGEVIRSRFGGRYVLTDLAHEGFLSQADGDPLLREVYRDEYAVIFEVRH